jgi:hypothetical protein
MYALFFGGKANVYAPTLFQFFGTQRIIAGSRLSTRLQVHNHLIKQHYLPKDTYTPEHRDAVLDSILDPAEFSEPLQLTSTHTDAPTAEATALVQAPTAGAAWDTEMLIDTVRETLSLAKIRAIDGALLTGLRPFLPAICLTGNTANETVSTNFLTSIIAEPTLVKA